MINPHRIKYMGIFSNELNMPDLIMDVAFDSDDGEMQTYLNRSAVQSESYDGRYKNTVRYKYDEVFAPKFTFMKNNFEDFSMEEVRLILKYLTGTDTTSLLEVYYDDSNVVSWAAIGGWTEIQLYKIANSRTVAVTAVFSSIMPFALSDLYTVTKEIKDATDNKITIEIDTDDNKPVYPRITIREKGSVVRIPTGETLNALSDMVENTVYFNGITYYWKTVPGTDDKYFNSSTTNPDLPTASVRFRNTHTDFFNQKKVFEPVIVKNNNTTENIVVDGANKIISSDSVNRIFGNDFVNWQWLELYDGKNEITIEGNCEVTLEWREIRKIGEY